MFETGVDGTNECKPERQGRRHNTDIFSVVVKVYCVFSLESPHRRDSNKYTQYTIFKTKQKKKKKNHPKLS